MDRPTENLRERIAKASRKLASDALSLKRDIARWNGQAPAELALETVSIESIVIDTDHLRDITSKLPKGKTSR